MDSFSISLIESLGVEFDSGFGGEEGDDSLHKLNPIFFLVDVVGDIGLRIVTLNEPIENISNELEIGLDEVL